MTEREQAEIIKADWQTEDFAYEVPIKLNGRTIRIDRILKSDYEVLKLIKNDKEKQRLFQELTNDARLIVKSIELKNKKQNIEKNLTQQTQTSQIEVVKLPLEEKINIYDNLDKYFDDFIEHKQAFKSISSSTIKNHTAALKYLKYFSDEKTEFTFSFFKEFQKKMRQMPKNFFTGKIYNNMSFESLLKLKAKEDYDTMSNKTINGHISNLRNIFEYLKYEEIINDNPVDSVMPLPETKGTNKEEYTPDEIKSILSSDMEIDYINMCKVALYCGLRISEVLSIKKEDIQDGFINVDLEDTDTKKHKRIIPIHKNLQPVIERQIRQNKGDFIFFYGNVGNEVSNVQKRINRKIKKVVPSKDKSFHSFRKNFSQEIELKTNTEEKIAKYLMGHSQSKDVTHMIYNRGKVNTDKLNDCINQITFEY